MIDFTRLLTGAFEPLARVIDELHTSEEERLHAKATLLRLQIDAAQQAQEYQMELLRQQSKIVAAEAAGQGVLQRNWRPITMLVFLTLVVADSLNFLPNRLSAEAWTLLQLGLGGYVVGRTGEKIVDKVKQ